MIDQKRHTPTITLPMHLYLCPNILSVCYYSNNLSRLLKPTPPLVPWLPPCSLHQKITPVNYPLSFSIINFPSLLDHSDQYKTGCYFSHLKKKKKSLLGPNILYYLLLFLYSLYSQTKRLAYSHCLHCFHSFLNPPYRAFVPTSPLKLLFSRSSMEWPPRFQIIWLYSVETLAYSWSLLPVQVPPHLLGLRTDPQVQSWKLPSTCTHSVDAVSWLQIPSKCF